MLESLDERCFFVMLSEAKHLAPDEDSSVADATSE